MTTFPFLFNYSKLEIIKLEKALKDWFRKKKREGKATINRHDSEKMSTSGNY